jgi:WD40-like Beta Propeller Repeat
MVLSAATVMAIAAAAAPGKLALPVGGGIGVVADDFAAAPVVVVAKADSPAWSPDGPWLAYTRDGRLEVAAADGTGPRVLDAVASGGSIGDVTWTPGGQVVYRRVGEGGAGAGVYAIAADGSGTRRPFLKPADPKAGAVRFVLNGRRVVFDRAGELWGARNDGRSARRLVSGPGADELLPLPDATGYVTSDPKGIVVLRPGGTVPTGDAVLRRLAGTAGRSPLVLAPDGARLLATVSARSGDRALGTDLVDLTGATPPRRVGGVDPDGVPVLGFAGPFGPSWWSPPPPYFTTAMAGGLPVDRRPPAFVIRSERDPYVVPVVRGARRVPTVRGLIDVSLLVLDQTGVTRVRVAWVRAGAKHPRWRDAGGPDGFWDTLPKRHGTYRLLLRATDALGQATAQPREVIVKLAP